jgi:hypothetical protein
MLITENDTLEIPTLPGEETHIAAIGTWDGATATLESYVDGGWRAVPDVAFTADFEIVRTNGPGTQLRLVIASAGASTSLSANLTNLPTA